MISRILSLGFVLAIQVTYSIAAVCSPSQIILIRHGEKPALGNDLNATGQKRAALLVNLFATDPRVLEFGPPAAIYAMAPGSDDGTLRSIETVTPLAQSLGLKINTSFTKNQANLIAADILSNPAYNGRMVLICWEHKHIPILAQALGATVAPTSWPDKVFDRLWILDYRNNQVTGFANLPQRLLPEDSAN